MNTETFIKLKAFIKVLKQNTFCCTLIKSMAVFVLKKKTFYGLMLLNNQSFHVKNDIIGSIIQ